MQPRLSLKLEPDVMTPLLRGSPMAPEVERSLKQRCALSTPEDTTRGMFFRGVLETVRRLGGPALEAECRKLLPEKRYLDFYSYPVTHFLQLSFLAAHLLADACGGFDEAQRRLGRQAAHDFLTSVAGKTLQMLARDEPRLLLEQLPTGFRLAVSYGERGMTWTGPTSGHFTMKRNFMPPAYHEGVLAAVLEAVGARDVQVHGRDTGVLGAEYAVSWR